MKAEIHDQFLLTSFNFTDFVVSFDWSIYPFQRRVKTDDLVLYSLFTSQCHWSCVLGMRFGSDLTRKPQLCEKPQQGQIAWAHVCLTDAE